MRLVWALALLCLVSCSGGDTRFVGGSSPGSPVVGVTPLADPPATARVGAEGGVVDLVTTDGTRYRLEVPAGALLEPVDLTLTAVTVTGLPVSGPVRGAVEMAPSGLVFLKAAKLTIWPPGDFDPSAFLPVGLGESGLSLLLGAGFPDRLEFTILHFSAAAAAEGTAAEASALAGAGVEGAVGNVVAQAALSGQGFTQQTRDAAEAVLRDHFLTVVKPALEGAQTDEALEAALSGFAQWQALVVQTDFQLHIGGAPLLNLSERQQGRHAVITALRAAVDRVNERTRAQQDWTVAIGVLHWNSLAQNLGVDVEEAGDPPGPALSLDAIADRLAVRVILEEATLPSTLSDPNASFDLVVRAYLGIVSANGAVLREVRDVPITVVADLLGASPEDSEGETDPANQGTFRKSLTLAAGSTDVAGTVTCTFPPVQVPIQTVRQMRADGAVRLTWSGPGSVDVNSSSTLTLKVEKGRGLARLRRATVRRDGGGTVTPESGLTDGDGLLSIGFQAPSAPGSTLLTASFEDTDHPLRPVVEASHAISVGGASPFVGTYRGTHGGVAIVGGSTGPTGNASVNVYSDQLHASFSVTGVGRVYIFSGRNPPQISGNQITASGTVYSCENCLGFPGTFDATVSPDGTTMTGTVSRDDTSVTFTATKIP